MKAMFVLCIALLAGCSSLVPTSRQENAATRVSDSATSKAGFEYAGTISPAFWPSVTVSNIGKGHVEVTMPQNYQANTSSEIDAKAGSKDGFNYALIKQIPLGVRIILIAVGLGALLAVWLVIRRYSVAAKAAGDIADRRVAEAIKKADTALASAIERNRTRAMVTDSDMEAKVAAVEVASLERARGIVNSVELAPAKETKAAAP